MRLVAFTFSLTYPLSIIWFAIAFTSDEPRNRQKRKGRLSAQIANCEFQIRFIFDSFKANELILIALNCISAPLVADPRNWLYDVRVCIEARR